MSPVKKARKIQPSSGKSFPNTLAKNTNGRFPQVIADALRRDFGDTHAAIKIVVGLTNANERAVKNWFDAKNAPTVEFLIALCRHSDLVLEAFLLLAGRDEQIKVRKLVSLRAKLHEMLAALDDDDQA